MRTLTVSDLKQSAYLQSQLTLTLSFKRGLKGPASKYTVAMFDIKLKVLMSTLTIDAYDFHLHVRLLKDMHTVF